MPVPFIFAAQGGSKVPASELDTNFQYVLDHASGGGNLEPTPYDSEATYQVGDAVTYQGSAFWATAIVSGIAPGSPLSPASPWQLIVSKGDQGVAGGTVVPQGAYSGATQYNENDLVTFLGSAYYTETPTIGVSPPSSPWLIFVSKGNTGDVTQAALDAEAGAQTAEAGAIAAAASIPELSADLLASYQFQIAYGGLSMLGMDWQNRAHYGNLVQSGSLDASYKYRADVGGIRLFGVRWDDSIHFGPVKTSLALNAQYKYTYNVGDVQLMRVGWDDTIYMGSLVTKLSLDAKYRYRRELAGVLLENLTWDGGAGFGAVTQYNSLDAKYGFVEREANGVGLRRIGWNGVAEEAARLDAYVLSGQAWLWRDGSDIQLTAGSTYTVIKAEVRGGQLTIVRSDQSRVVTPVAGAIVGYIAPTVTKIEYSDTYGQSLAAGNSNTVYHTTPDTSGFAFTFIGGPRAYGTGGGHDQEKSNLIAPVPWTVEKIVPAFERQNGNAGETSCFEYMQQRIAASANTVAYLTTDSAIGSCTLEMLKKVSGENPDNRSKTGSPWADLETRFWRAALLTRLLGYIFESGILRWNQGEGNILFTKANYQAGLVIIQSDWQNLVQAGNALPASGKARMICAQTCSGAHYDDGTNGATRSQVPWAQLQVAKTDVTKFGCTGPFYDQTYASDGVHLSAQGQIMQGARQAEMELAANTSKLPLYVVSAPHSGTTVHLTLNNPFGNALEFDTTNITGLGADQGFQFDDDSHSATVTVATIIDATHVDLTLSNTFSGTNPFIYVAQNGTQGGNSGPATGNRSTLRTKGSGASTTDGRVIYHYVCIDQIAVT